MKKDEALRGLSHLIGEWAKEKGINHGQAEMPSFGEFRNWVEAKGYSNYFDFKTTMGPIHEAELLFDKELGQSWRN